MAITRINFIEREPFVLTYRKMAILFAGVIALSILISLFQYGNSSIMNRRIDKLSEEIADLKVKRERALLVAKKEGVGVFAAQQKLKNSFEKSPAWCSVFKRVVAEMPPSLWLESVRSYDKPDAPSGKGLILIGQAPSAREVSEFLKALSESFLFKGVVLSTSRQEEGEGGERRYHFTIDSALARERGI